METIDLFEHPELLPDNVQEVLLKYGSMDNTYEQCERLLKELKPLGYTFEYYLDAQPFNLTKIMDINQANYELHEAAKQLPDNINNDMFNKILDHNVILIEAAKCALADLEGIMPEFEPSGDRQHSGWKTINELKKALYL